jgi:hypothetical protein
MKPNSKLIYQGLNILSWIIFIGLCIEAGAIIFNVFYTLLVNNTGTSQFYKNIDLAALFQFDKGYYVAVVSIMSIVAVLKAIIFYLIIKIQSDKKISLERPFTQDVAKFIFTSSMFTLFIGFFCIMGANYTDRFIKQGVQMPDLEALQFTGADVWLFMAVTLFLIAQIIKKGIEIQSENELTV